VGLKSLKSLNLTNGYPNKNKKNNKKKKNNNNKVKSKPLELFELAGKKNMKHKNLIEIPPYYIDTLVWSRAPTFNFFDI
jgi:hypothetical protein